MKKVIFAILALILLGGLGVLIYQRIGESRVTQRRGGPRPTPVEAAEIERGNLVDTRAFRGTLVARSQFVLAPKVSGRLERLSVDIGDEVQRGDLVGVLDSEEYFHQVEQVRAELSVSEAALDDAESKLAVATSDLNRVRKLHEEGVASDANLEEAEARQQAATAQVKLARAQIRQREASLRSAEVRLAYTRLSADWDEGKGDTWLVAERFVDEGSMLRANDPVISVVDTGTLRAVVYVIERDFPAVAPGQPAFISTDAYPGEVFRGKVVRRAPVLDERSRHARVEIEVDNPDGRLAPGMFVRVRIQLEERFDVPVLPESALARRNQTIGVFKVDKEAMTVRFIEVETGIRSAGKAELITPADLEGYVVTLGHHLLEDGAAVFIPSEEAADFNGSRPGQGGGGIQ